MSLLLNWLQWIFSLESLGISGIKIKLLYFDILDMIYKVPLTEHAMEVDLFQYCSMVIDIFIYFYFIFQDRAFFYSTGYNQTHNCPAADTCVLGSQMWHHVGNSYAILKIWKSFYFMYLSVLPTCIGVGVPPVCVAFIG